MASYNIYEAKTRLSALLEKVSAGEDVVIAKAGKPIARIVPLDPPANRGTKLFRNSFGENHGSWGDMDAILDHPLNEEEQRAFGMLD
jgi:prevent-host-death family protein